jgi:hypothetical protein
MPYFFFFGGASQAYGPVPEEKLLFEADRLNRVLDSVRKVGYWLQQSDVPTFQLLVDDSDRDRIDYSLLVISGNHRAAVLAFLGWDTIPMRVSPEQPREVRMSDLEYWPGVVDGGYSKEATVAYFRAFFRDPHEVLLPSW